MQGDDGTMANVWEFFEDLDEMVYVSDLETHELIYMNRYLRKALGYDSHEAYSGKTCYEVLQNFQSPCFFCTNQRLQPGKFVSWTHKNPVFNKRFLIKDTIIRSQGRDYRIEIAIDADSETVCQTPYYYSRSETILNECMQHMFSNTNPEESIQNMLSYIGKTFSCDRAYIFELYDNQVASNTYEWCSEHAAPQKELLQNVPISAIDWWLALFANNEVTLISDLEDIRTSYPESYALLKPQDIHSLAAGPIMADGLIIGFLGVDNPDGQMRPLITPLLSMIGYFTSTLLKRRDLLARLNELSYHDQLTGALNRHALSEHYGDLPMESVGVIYCDITGLKMINDTQGHEAGDQLICHCYELLQNAVDTAMVYRTGGDEFIALYPNCKKAAFYDSLRTLQQAIREDECHIAVGHVWSDTQPLNLEKLITQADQVMYQNKRSYYRENSHLPGVERRRPDDSWIQTSQRQADNGADNSLFHEFLAKANCDVGSLFQSVSQDNDSSYFYFGDMQKDLFYISDNMRDDFGFPHNIVRGLLEKWAKRISTQDFQELFRKDISSMLQEKRTLHDLRYQVRDIHGNNLWVRCYGILKWDKDKPLFFSGRVTHQDKNFVIDPISNLPREHASFLQLDELKNAGKKSWL